MHGRVHSGWLFVACDHRARSTLRQQISAERDDEAPCFVAQRGRWQRGERCACFAAQAGRDFAQELARERRDFARRERESMIGSRARDARRGFDRVQSIHGIFC